MNSRTILTTFAALSLLAATVVAATRQWNIPTAGVIYQVVGDGKGGCAFPVKGEKA